MKRFFGWVLALAGGAAVVWGGFNVLSGQSETRVHLGTVSVDALTGGLIGLALATLGFIWVRD